MIDSDFWSRKDLSHIEKLIFIYLLNNNLSAKDLESIFQVSGVTIRKSLSNLKKLDFITKGNFVKETLQTENVKKSLQLKNVKESLQNTEVVKKTLQSDFWICKENLTNFYDVTQICKENLTFCKEILTKYTGKHWYDENLRKKVHKERNIINYIYNISNNIIYLNRGLPLTSFGLTPLRYFTVNLHSVNDIDHKNQNSVKKLPAPKVADQKQNLPGKTFKAPTLEQVLEHMNNYVLNRVGKYPLLTKLDTERQAEDFISFYENKTWKVGNVKMKSWELAAERWLRQSCDNLAKGKIAPKKLTDAEIMEQINRQQQKPESVVSANSNNIFDFTKPPFENAKPERELTPDEQFKRELDKMSDEELQRRCETDYQFKKKAVKIMFGTELC